MPTGRCANPNPSPNPHPNPSPNPNPNPSPNEVRRNALEALQRLDPSELAKYEPAIVTMQAGGQVSQ